MELFNENENINPYVFFNKKHEEILKKDFPEFYKKNKNKFIIEKNRKEDISKSILGKFFYRINQVRQISKTINNNKIKFICVNTIQTKKKCTYNFIFINNK